MYAQRTLKTFLERVTQQFPVILVTGPRQVGKTTFLQHLSQENRTYVTLDDPALATLANDEPRLFLERFKPPLLIDEIQYAPKLLPFIKMAVDKNRVPGQFWLTGSQQFHLMKNVSESLAGRIGIVNLLGLSLWERQGLGNMDEPFLPTPEGLKKREKLTNPVDLMDLYTKIWRGSFPVMAIGDGIDRDLFYSSYVQTYLQRDVQELAKVGDGLTFLKFLRAAAARTGQLLNLADFARDCDMSQPTAKNWLSILKTSGIVYLLEPYHTNLTKRIIKTPKLYFLDTGLCSYLTEWSSPRTLEAGAMSGAILETFVISEIIKSYWHNGKQAPLFYYRDKDKKEVDLIIIQDRILYPLEIKKTGSPDKKTIRHFPALGKLGLDMSYGGVICLTDRILPITSGINAIPVGLV